MSGLLENIKNRLNVGSLEYCKKMYSVSLKLFGKSPHKVTKKLMEYTENIEINSISDCTQIVGVFGKYYNVPDKVKQRIEECIAENAKNISSLEECIDIKKLFRGGYINIPPQIRSQIEIYVATVKVSSIDDCEKIIEVFSYYYNLSGEVKEKIIEYLKTVEVNSIDDCVRIRGLFGDSIYDIPKEVSKRIREYVEKDETLSPSSFNSLLEGMQIYSFAYNDENMPNDLLKQMKEKYEENPSDKESYQDIPLSILFGDKKTKIEYLKEKLNDDTAFGHIYVEKILNYTIFEDRDDIASSVINELDDSRKIYILELCSSQYIEEYIDKNPEVPGDKIFELIKSVTKRESVESSEKLVRKFMDRLRPVINERDMEKLVGLCSVEYICECIYSEEFNLANYYIRILIEKLAKKFDISDVEILVKKYIEKFPGDTVTITELIALCSVEYIVKCMDDSSLNLSPYEISRIIENACANKSDKERDILIRKGGEKIPPTNDFYDSLITAGSAEFIQEYIDNNPDLSEGDIYHLILNVSVNTKTEKFESLVKNNIDKFSDISHIKTLISACSVEYIMECIATGRISLPEEDFLHLIETVAIGKSDIEVEKLVKQYMEKYPNSSNMDELINLCSLNYIEEYIDDKIETLDEKRLNELLLKVIRNVKPEKLDDIIKKYIDRISSKEIITEMLEKLSDFEFGIDYLRKNQNLGLDIREIILNYFSKFPNAIAIISKDLDLTQKDEVTTAILYAKLQKGKIDIDEKSEIIKILIGEEKFNSILEGRLGSINKLSNIVKEIGSIDILKILDSEFINNIGGIDNYIEFLKYSARNKNFSNVISIIENDKQKGFFDFFSFVSNIISLEGVKRFEYLVKVATLYTQNESFCNEIKDRELSTEDKNNFVLLLTGDVERDKDLTSEKFNTMFEDNMEETLSLRSCDAIKENIFKYLLGVSEEDVIDIVNRFMSVSRAIRIRESAEEKGNRALVEEAKFFEIIFEIIEQIIECKDVDKLKSIVERIHYMDKEKIQQLRVQLHGIKEKIRVIYEHDSQSELTDIGSLLPEEILENETPIVDLSRKKYLIYMHKTDKAPEDFLANSINRNTNICVSPNSDEHLAFYGGSSGIRVGFTNLKQGAFIGSSPKNMGSNGFIGYNDFDIERASVLFHQEPVRDSFASNMEHGETLLFTYGLLPTCVVMQDPMDEEKVKEEADYARKLQDLIRDSIRSQIYEGMPEEERQAILKEADSIIIPLVKTQKLHERVFSYDIAEGEKNTKRTEEKGETGKDIFNSLRKLLVDENSVIDERNNKFVYNGKIYCKSKTPALTKAIQKLQEIVHINEEQSHLRTVEVNGELLVEIPQSKASLEGYTRNSGEFAKKTYEGLLMEFLTDHLIASYLPSNESFSINTDGTVYRFEREGFTSIEDFYSGTGTKPYTGMTYYRFDSSVGNNLYRKMFEQHINNGIFTDSDWEKLEEAAQRIKAIPSEEYNKIFEDYINILPQDKREVAMGILASRRFNIVEDVKEFKSRVESLRKEKENVEEFENGDKIAFINDIHGNFEALKSLIEDLEKKGKTDIFILGDIIGFGAQSNECLDYIRKKEQEGLRIKSLLGNHELYVLMGNSSNGAPEHDKKEVEMDIKEISPENRRYIESFAITKTIKINGKLIELTHFPQRKEFAQDSDIYIAHGMAKPMRDDVDYVVFGHEHLIENTSEVIQPKVNGKFINLPSSGCVHGTQATYTEVEVDQKGALIFTTHGVDYDWEKNSKELKDKRPNRSEFYYTK